MCVGFELLAHVLCLVRWLCVGDWNNNCQNRAVDRVSVENSLSSSLFVCTALHVVVMLLKGRYWLPRESMLPLSVHTPAVHIYMDGQVLRRHKAIAIPFIPLVRVVLSVAPFLLQSVVVVVVVVFVVLDPVVLL